MPTIKWSNMPAEKVDEMLHLIEEFPTLPSVVARVVEVLDNPYSSAGDLTEIVKLDQAMMLRLLKMANSAYYGFPRAISTVTESIVLLGFATVRNLILTTTIYNFDQLWLKPRGKGRKPLFSQRAQWKHAVATAIAAREILLTQHREGMEHIGYLAGLLHDVGKLLLAQHYYETYEKVLAARHSVPEAAAAQERELLGVDHGAIAGRLVDHWNLPAGIVAPITFHHFPEEASEQKELTRVVQVADRLAHWVMSDPESSQAANYAGWLREQQNEIQWQGVEDLKKNILSEVVHIESYLAV
jgi:HD-like signal output (HDOD) protein